MLRMILAAFLSLFLITEVSAQGVTLESGGLKDPATGLIWGDNLRDQTGSWWTWNPAFDIIAGFTVTDSSTGQVYDDWRMVSVTELQNIVANNKPLVEEILKSQNVEANAEPTGEMQYSSGAHGVWTGTTQGGSAYVVFIETVGIWDAEGVFVGRFVTGNTQVELMKKSMFAGDAFMVRGAASGGTGTKGGKK